MIDLDTSPFEKGMVLADRYRIAERLGAGAMGWVVKAYDENLSDEEIALKILYPHLTTNRTYTQRFHSEILIARKLLHKNILRTYAFGNDETYHFISMELVNGRTLDEIIEAEEALPLPTALRILKNIALGMSHAHSYGVIHRDIKPENILVSEDWSIKIADFGISQLRQESSIETSGEEAIGTPQYMSPEQFRGEALDATSDIYSFGILMYELLTGRRPFNGNTLFMLAEQHFYEPMPSVCEQNANLPQWVEELILTCTAKSKNQRFQRFDEICAVMKPHIPRSSATTIDMLPANSEVPDDIDYGDKHRFVHIPAEQQKSFRFILKLIEVFAILSLLLLIFGATPGVRNTALLIFILAVTLWPAMHGTHRHRLSWYLFAVPFFLFFCARNNPASWQRTATFILKIERASDLNVGLVKKLLNIPLEVDSTQSLFTAVRGGRKGHLLAMINSGMNVDVSDSNGLHIMHAVVKEENNANLSYLLRAGVRFDVKDQDGQTPLHLAALSSQSYVVGGMVDHLLLAGANPNEADRKGRTPLWNSAATGQWPVVVLMCSFNAVVEQILNINGRNTSVLHLSIISAPVSHLRAIIAKVKNFEIEDHQGRTPLHLLTLADPKHQDRL